MFTHIFYNSGPGLALKYVSLERRREPPSVTGKSGAAPRDRVTHERLERGVDGRGGHFPRT